MKARRRAAVAAALLVLSGVAAGCASPSGLAWAQNGSEQPAAALPADLVQPGLGVPVGVYEQGFPGNASLIGTFATATGVRPRFTQYYSSWGERFWTNFATASRDSGAVPVVQLNPSGIKLATITSGHWDTYLRAYADAVKAYGHPVILSFGHEMNGNWYSWASGHQTPAAFIAAWQHVVAMFRHEGATNATWLWTVTAVAGSGLDSPWSGRWWPGGKWVNLVGVDGYYYRPSDTFNSVFGTALAQIRSFTKAPLIISEVGIGPNPNRDGQIRALFADVKTSHISAVIWFDVPQKDGIYHQDWQLEGHPSALAAFRAAAIGS